MKFIISHGGCDDGLAGAWVGHKALPDASIIFTSRKHGWKDKLTVSAGDIVYFIDFCPYPIDMLNFINSGVECIVLDHHESDLNKIKEFDGKNNTNLMSSCFFDLTKAGCLVAWDYFFKDQIPPKLLEYISIADTWKWRGDKDHAIIQYFRTILDSGDTSIEEFDGVLNSFDEEKYYMLGMALHKRVKKDAISIARKYCIMDFDGTKVAAVNGTLYNSEIGHELSLVSPCGIGVVYTIIPESDTVKISARGIGANKFCEKYNGGGHPEAAGAYFNLNQFNKYLTTATKKDKIGSEE